MTVITLEWSEVGHGAICGARRRVASLARGLSDRHGAESLEPWGLNIDGALGEMAVAKAMGVYWEPHVNAGKRPDVGDWHVRTTHLQQGCLIVRESDPRGLYVLVTGTAPTFDVRGCIRWPGAEEAMGAQRSTFEPFFKSPGGRPGAWFIPQNELAEML